MFVGRDDELEAVLRVLDAPTGTLAVAGEGGVGKTRLVVEAAARAGREVLRAGGLATLNWMAYAPLRRALGESLSAPGWSDDPESAAGRLEEVLGARVLFLDDMQWADPGTHEVVRLLVGRIPLVVTVRSGEPQSVAVSDLLAELGVPILRLEPLTREQAHTLASRVRPDARADELEVIAARSGGNPLVIEELAAGGARARSLALALAARLRPLPDEALRELRLLALAEHPLARHHVPSTELLAAADLIVIDGETVEVRHAMLAQVVAAAIPDGDRAALHRELARLLEHPGDAAQHLLLSGDRDAAHAAALRAVDSATTPGERSRHLLTAARSAGEDAAAPLLIRAAQAAVEAGDYAVAGQVLDALPERIDRELRTHALVSRLVSARERGDREGWLRWSVEAVGTAPEGTDVEVLALAERARAVLMAGQNVAEATEIAERAARLADDRRAHRGRSLYVLGTAYYFGADARWQPTLERARLLAREEGDLHAELSAANNLLVGHESSGSPREAARIAGEQAIHAHDLQLERWRRHFAAAGVNLAMHAGELAAVDTEAARLLAQPLMPRTRAGVAAAWAMVLVDLARFDDAVQVAEDELEHSIFPSHAAHIRALVSAATGEPDAALAELPTFVERVENDHLLAFAAPTFHWAALRAGREEPELGPIHAAEQVPMLFAVPRELDAIRSLREGDPHAALAALLHAAELWAPYHRRGELRCVVEAAAVRVDLATGMPVEHPLHASAVDAVETATRDAVELGMEAETMRVDALRRRIGLPARRHPSRAQGGLTERERQVMRLVLVGLTDAAIGARLGISARTVETHIRSARAKLGARNRDQAAALAADA